MNDSLKASSYWTNRDNENILTKACSNNMHKSSKEMSKLHCKMLSTNLFTKIAPFKVEVANLDPFIAVFHEIISNDEISILFSIVNRNLTRAKVFVGNSIISDQRVAKNNIFDDDAHRILPTLSRRVGGNFQFFSARELKKIGIIFYRHEWLEHENSRKMAISELWNWWTF
jgi:hypothetical protein